MSVEYPWILANSRINVLIEKLASAARPERFTQDFLEKLGFGSSNDRAFIPLLRKLGFLSESNQPTTYYDLLRDPSERQYVLAERIRDVYSDLFSVNTQIYKASDQDIKGALTRVTGKDETTVDRNFRTFKALLQLANFEGPAVGNGSARDVKTPEIPMESEERQADVAPFGKHPKKPSFHYNIQIILPATTEIAVYNAIFKSLKDNLDL